MDTSYKNVREYNSLLSAKDEYNRQKLILKDYTDKWKQQTLKYLNFSAKEQMIPGPLDIYPDINIYPDKLSWNSSYAQYLQRVRAENKIGLNKTNSFNRDKYGRKPPTHQYKLMGDVLRRPSKSAPVSVMSLNQTPRISDQIASRGQMNGTVGDYSQKRYAKWKERTNNRTLSPFLQSSAEMYGGIKLSTNIKHKYGSNVCDELLNDECAVVQTMADIDRKDIREKRATPLFRQGFGLSSHNLSRSCSQQLSYHDLSNTLRSNIFPGDGIIYNCGATHADYNEDVYNIPCQLSEHRRRKIELNV